MGTCPVCQSKAHNFHFDQVIHYRIRTDIGLGQHAIVPEEGRKKLQDALEKLFDDWTTEWQPHKAIRIVAHIEEPFRFNKEVTLKPGPKWTVGGFYQELSSILNTYIKSYPGWKVPPQEDPKGGIHILENGGNGC